MNYKITNFPGVRSVYKKKGLSVPSHTLTLVWPQHHIYSSMERWTSLSLHFSSLPAACPSSTSSISAKLVPVPPPYLTTAVPMDSHPWPCSVSLVCFSLALSQGVSVKNQSHPKTRWTGLPVGGVRGFPQAQSPWPWYIFYHRPISCSLPLQEREPIA